MIRFKIFLDPIIGLERWLNKKGEQGLQLTKVSIRGVTYNFNESNVCTYGYRVIPTRDMKSNDILDYIDKLRSNGYFAFLKSSNYFKFTLYNFRMKGRFLKDDVKFYAKSNTNKEIIIVMKKQDEKDVLDIYNKKNYEVKDMIFLNLYLIFICIFLSFLDLGLSLILFNLGFTVGSNIIYLKIILGVSLATCVLKALYNIICHLNMNN